MIYLSLFYSCSFSTRDICIASGTLAVCLGVFVVSQADTSGGNFIGRFFFYIQRHTVTQVLAYP